MTPVLVGLGIKRPWEADTKLCAGSLGELSEVVVNTGTCSFCSLVVGGTRICCFQCGAMFHGEPSCVGVSEEVVGCVCGAGCEALRYICIRCRSGKTETVDFQVVFSEHLVSFQQ